MKSQTVPVLCKVAPEVHHPVAGVPVIIVIVIPQHQVSLIQDRLVEEGIAEDEWHGPLVGGSLWEDGFFSMNTYESFIYV